MKLKSPYFIVLIIFCLLLGGCHWMGKTAGKVQAKVERKTEDIGDGYREGYESEKAKTESQ